MRNLWRAYRALLRVAWEMALEYRAQALLWFLSGIFPLVMMVVWLALVDEAGPISGWGRSDFLSYYIAAAIIYEFTFSWTIWQWDEDIRTGSLSVKLLKPLDPFHHLLSEQLGWKLFILIFIVPLAVAVTLASPLITYPITGPLDLGKVAAFLLSVAAGFVLSNLMSSAFAMIAFWSTLSGNVYGLWIGVGQFMAGWIAPLALFPAWFRQIAALMPFRSTLGFPVEILTGRLSWAEIVFGFAVTGGWIVFFLVIYRVLWRFGLRRYEAVGA